MINCPNCSANLKFNIALQMLHCASCDSSFDTYEFDSKDEDGVESKYETTVFTCPECAGEIESTDTDVTGFCPFCGASTIFYSRLKEELKPDFVIPFKKTKEDCKNIYKKHAKKALFLPNEYKSEEHIDGFRGIYVPYWAYNASQEGRVTFKGEKTHRRGDYIIHDNFRLTGEIDSFYNGISYDASSSFSDDISQKIAPFNVKEKQPFTAGYLSGFYADTADVDSDVYSKDALEFAKSRSRIEIKKEPTFRPYSISNLANNNLNTKVSNIERTMYPVWFMSYRNKDRVAYATINGQTGKIYADFPIDIKKFLVFSAFISVILFLILNLFLTLKPTTCSFVTMLIAIVALVLYIYENYKISRWDADADDRGKNAYIAKKKGFKTPFVDVPKRPLAPVPLILSIIAIVASFAIWVSATIHDWMHYSVSAGCSVCIAVTLIYLIKDYNMLATRPLPQFKKTGGDDRA